MKYTHDNTHEYEAYINGYKQAANTPAPVKNDRTNEINTKSHEMAETIVIAMTPPDFDMSKYRETRTYPTYAILKTDIYMGVKGIMLADLYQNNKEFDSYEFWLEYLETAIAKLRKFFVDPTDPTLID